SRRRHTRFDCDWSSDVCSSDLNDVIVDGELGSVTALAVTEPTPKYALLNRLLAEDDPTGYDFVLTVDDDIVLPAGFLDLFLGVRSEERRVGKECGALCWRDRLR